MSDAARLKSTVYVGGLDSTVTKPTLHSLFLPFGEIIEINLPLTDSNSASSSHRGFAYVEFESPEDAKAAIDNLDQSALAGKTLNVAQAKPQKEAAAQVLGSKTAVWEQEEWLRKNEVSEEDREAQEEARKQEMMKAGAGDPMAGLEELVVGPKVA